MFEMKMPKLGASMIEGTIVRWFVEEGEHVQKGDPIVEIQSDKIVLEVEAETDGTVQKQLHSEGEIVPIFKTIAFIGDGEMHEIPQPKEQTNLPKEGANHPTERKVRRSPAARKLANKLNIDLNQIKGSGPKGRITKQDVENETKQSILIEETTENQQVQTQFDQHYTETKLSPVRKIIAERMTQSATVPHVTLHIQADATKLMKLRKKLQKETGIKTISFNDLLVKATIIALKRYPYMMNQLHDNRVRSFQDVHIGIAVHTAAGLVVPVLKYAHHLSLLEVVEQTKQIIEEVRGGTAHPVLFEGGTFTVSNLGSFGIEGFTPIINPPQSAILGVGTLTETLCMKKGKVKQCTMIHLSLSFDHRVMDGVPAAQFLKALKAIIERPIELLL